MRELSAEARLHFYARQIARKSGSGIHTAALYSAAVIAAIVPRARCPSTRSGRRYVSKAAV